MAERKVPILIQMEPELLRDADRVASERPEFSGNRSELVRQAIRELLDRIEADRTPQQTEAAA